MGYGLVCGLWFCGCGLHRKIRLTQLWVELSWVVATKNNVQTIQVGINRDCFLDMHCLAYSDTPSHAQFTQCR